MKIPTDDKQVRCLWCGQVSAMIWVHGHGQCGFCGTNIDECCRGEILSSPALDQQGEGMQNTPCGNK